MITATPLNGLLERACDGRGDTSMLGRSVQRYLMMVGLAATLLSGLTACGSPPAQPLKVGAPKSPPGSASPTQASGSQPNGESTMSPPTVPGAYDGPLKRSSPAEVAAAKEQRDAKPKARPRPDEQSARRAAKRDAVRVDEYRAKAAVLPSSVERGRTIGEVGGAEFHDLVYGDVANEMSAGSVEFPADAVTLRLVWRAPGPAKLTFQVVAVDLNSDRMIPYAYSGSSRPPTWTMDDSSTGWAD